LHALPFLAAHDFVSARSGSARFSQCPFLTANESSFAEKSAGDRNRMAGYGVILPSQNIWPEFLL